MTSGDRNLKRAIRERMRRTGEPYTLARRMVLQEQEVSPVPSPETSEEEES